MKKLSIVALVISIIALLISIWVWTDGFGAAGTFIARPISSTKTTNTTTTGGTDATGTVSAQNAVSITVQSGSDSRVPVVRHEGTPLFTMTLKPLTYAAGSSNVLVGYQVTALEVAAGATGFVSELEAIERATPVLTSTAAYADKVAQKITAEIDTDDLRQRMLRVDAASSDLGVLVFNQGGDLKYPYIINQPTFTGTTLSASQQGALLNFVRTIMFKYPLVSSEVE